VVPAEPRIRGAVRAYFRSFAPFFSSMTLCDLCSVPSPSSPTWGRRLGKLQHIIRHSETDWRAKDV
jgi:hypothetical protein